ncbi:Arc family DNA-binding protein [Acinetobacter radioresistens]|uniref:Arc family DNA-binding protein n=1 Tax=Acinetobacter radioresistens TaxID=40216 RepID=UPI0021D2FA0F|nr:Arc family DNA-binding protein [Acinetobacter radioresistens]MCU4623470.1 Arc family DNA-binding protein [Acinetobacter radioresistens]
MARTDPQVNFRIPAELKDKLDQAAKDNGRTLTAELILRLEMTFEQDDHLQDLVDRIEKLEEAIDSIEYYQNDHGRRIDALEGRY